MLVQVLLSVVTMVHSLLLAVVHDSTGAGDGEVGHCVYARDFACFPLSLSVAGECLQHEAR
jgi:hypothetical protein